MIDQLTRDSDKRRERIVDITLACMRLLKHYDVGELREAAEEQERLASLGVVFRFKSPASRRRPTRGNGSAA